MQIELYLITVIFWGLIITVIFWGLIVGDQDHMVSISQIRREARGPLPKKCGTGTAHLVLDVIG